jgi:prophage tail gpP-like protein
MRVAAQLFQAAFRRRKARRQYNEAKQSAVLLQSHMRGHLQRKRYQQERAAAVLFQTAYHGLKAKRFLALQRRLMLKRRYVLRPAVVCWCTLWKRNW